MLRAVDVHLVLPLLSPLLSFNPLALAFLSEDGLQVLGSPVVVLGVLWVLERSGILVVGELLCKGLPSVY